MREKVEEELARLRAARAEVEGDLRKAQAACAQLQQRSSQLNGEIQSLLNQKQALGSEVAKLQARDSYLIHEIEQSLIDLRDVEELERSHRDKLTQIQRKLASRDNELKLLNSFTGLIDHTSFQRLETFAAMLPNIVAEAKAMRHDPTLLKNQIFARLTGGLLRTTICRRCNARFAVDTPAQGSCSYTCPSCGLAHCTDTAEDESTVVKDLFEAARRLAAMTPSENAEADKLPADKQQSPQ